MPCSILTENGLDQLHIHASRVGENVKCLSKYCPHLALLAPYHYPRQDSTKPVLTTEGANIAMQPWRRWHCLDLY